MDPQPASSTLDTPIAKSRPFTLALRWFVIGCASVASVHWLFLDALNIHEQIFKSGTTVWSWVYFVFFAILGGALAASIRLTNYYRATYQNYRCGVWVDNVYVTRAELQGKYISLIARAEKQIDIFGISLHTLMQKPDTKSAIVTASTGKNKIAVRILERLPKFISE